MTKQTTNKVTKDAVLALINETLTDPTTGETIPTPRASKAIERALVALYAKQTGDERASKSTNHDNGQGFTGVDAQFLSDLAETVLGIGEWTHRETGRRYARKGPKSLTLGQLKAARKQLQKYGTQLAGIANEKAAAKAAETEGAVEPSPVVDVTPEPVVVYPKPALESLTDLKDNTDKAGTAALIMDWEGYVARLIAEVDAGKTDLSTLIDEMGDLISKLPERSGLRAAMVEVQAVLRGEMARRLLTFIKRQFADGEPLRSPEDMGPKTPAVETPKVNPVHLPTADEVPMADPNLRKEDEPTTEPEDDFDRIFGKPEPRTPSAANHMSVTESVEMWAERTYGNRFDGRGGNGRGGRKTEPTRFEMALKAIPVG